ncbi:hypothetical protein [Pyrococcus kukulkanii]|uniref:Uncharacterized protein n=1 Tax=Pyrococcus kukulkanii TaxID=1609559 RepID=A0ABV4T9P9_9EURY
MILIISLGNYLDGQKEEILRELENDLYWLSKLYGLKYKVMDLDKVIEELEANFSKYFSMFMEDEHGQVWVELGEIKEALRRVVGGED